MLEAKEGNNKMTSLMLSENQPILIPRIKK
jgi:hypothetical protein